MSMTLDDLLRSLEKQASDQEATDKEEDKTKEKKTGSEDKVTSAEKEVEEAKKTEDRVKEAQLQGAALANEIMQKVASANLTNKETEMNKSAQFAGQALAQSLLTKLAGIGDMSTADSIDPTAVPNKAQRDNAAMVSEHDAIIDPTPTANAVGNDGGSVNEIFDAILAKAMAQGARISNQVTGGPTLAQVEGAVAAHAVPNGVPVSPAGVEDEVEKVAAVSALVGSGFDFDSAVNMVKAAEQEILFEEDQQIKQAAMAELMNSGVDFELAAAMVKQAGIPSFLKPKGQMINGSFVPANMLESAKARVGQGVGAVTDAYGKAKGGVVDAYGKAKGGVVDAYGMASQDAKGFGQAVRQAAMGRDAVGSEINRVNALRRAALDTYTGRGLLGAGAAGLGYGGYQLAREKQAALNGLLDSGIDFDTAAQLVSETSQELYGA